MHKSPQSILWCILCPVSDARRSTSPHVSFDQTSSLGRMVSLQSSSLHWRSIPQLQEPEQSGSLHDHLTTLPKMEPGSALSLTFGCAAKLATRDSTKRAAFPCASRARSFFRAMRASDFVGWGNCRVVFRKRGRRDFGVLSLAVCFHPRLLHVGQVTEPLRILITVEG